MRDFTRQISYREMTVFLMPLVVVKLFEVLSLAVFVISGSDFDSLIGSFFCIFVCMGAATGICCHIALKRWEEEARIGE